MDFFLLVLNILAQIRCIKTKTILSVECQLYVLFSSQVVQRIKAVEDETRLLLIDSEAEVYYKQNDIVISGEMENVL